MKNVVFLYPSKEKELGHVFYAKGQLPFENV